MDINNLFTDEGLRAFTAARRDQHMQDASQYDQIADVIQRRLEQTPIDGDRPFSARRRARKVARRMRRMARSSRKAAASSEALYAAYVSQVLELPQRREQEAARKAHRQQRPVKGSVDGVAERVTSSLDRSIHQLNGTTPRPAPQAGTGQAGFLPPTPFPYPIAAGGEGQPPAPRTVSDFFPKAGR